ncbi:unnamed protein product [Mytilus coruscus]|uniref:Fungal lipase-type domain-containing protein n=1 Tax=Mytilus coruscus TaxID=42192 RepID=A0A6J8CV93_MYTCO|nr:unnamed protein product [Mytilus coruscus]
MILILLLLNISVLGYIDCDTHTSNGCEYCVQQSSWWDHCRWCELDEQCHATGSEAPYNQCNKDQVTTDVRNCPKPRVYREYNPDKAYMILKLSAILYADDHNGALTCLHSLEMDDFEIVEWIGRHCEDLSLLAYKECVATVMISHKHKVIVLAYRGTTGLIQCLDEIQSVLFSSKVSGGIGNGEVQEYFKEAHDQISNYPNYNIWITGHSLGGVIASVASASLIYHRLIKDEKIALYTFGMPKVVNRQYALEHNRLVTNSWRVVHRDDPIPHYPISTGVT